MNPTTNPNNPPSDEPLLRYVLCARKSSEDVGAQAKSLLDQIQACVEYAENNGLKVVEILKESHSAKISRRRPIFSQMLKDIEAGKYDGILTWHPDRLARNSLEAGMIVDMVDNGVIKDLKFPTLAFTNDSSSKLLLNIMFAMSKQYSEHLSESVQRGVNSNIAQGKSGGTPKWGYNRSEVTGLYEPDGNFDYIKHGFEMYLDGHSQADIMAYWRQHDVHRMTKLTRKNKNVRGRIVLEQIYEAVDALKFNKRSLAAAEAELTGYIDHRHDDLVAEKLSISASIKAKQRDLEKLAESYLNLGKDAPGEATTLIKKQMHQCRQAIADLQIERDRLAEKIFNPDQVQEVLTELTNNLSSLGFKIRSGDSWQKDQLARKLLTNIELDNQNRLTYRYKSPISDILTTKKDDQVISGAPD